MSLRMNLYGWSVSAFTRVLGSKDTALLEAASARLTEHFKDESARSRATAWVRTLIDRGYPLRQDREPSPEPADGSLLTVRMETEVHAFAVYSIVRTIARGEHLDLATDSSFWNHDAVVGLYQESSACGFSRSSACCVDYFTWMGRLSNGSPLFGDDFRTSWSFYTWFGNQELAAMIPVLQAAIDFKRRLPRGHPEAMLATTTSLSESARGFAADLVKWFGQIQQAGQDAFILWW